MGGKELTNSADVLTLMRSGYEVRNHGAGWWVSLPHQAYKAHKTQRIADLVITDMEAAGLIKTRLTGKSAIAELVASET